MKGRIIKSEGWMSYRLHIDGESKPRRIYWRNHNNTYIKQNSAWVRVYFNHWLLDKSFAEIPMILNAEDEWEMAHEYEQNTGAKYAIVGRW